MPEVRITRRRALNWMAASAIGLVVASGLDLGGGLSPKALAGTDEAPKPPFTSLEVRTAEALARTAFPFAGLADAVYASLTADYLKEIAANPGSLGMFKDGLARLNRSYIANFPDLPPLIQIEVLAENDHLPFFQGFRWRMAELVFRSRQLWALVGYQGSSLEYGGYIHRGFNDINWLPKI